MKQATVFYIHPGKKTLHGISVDTVIVDAASDNAVADILSKGYHRSPRAALEAFQSAQKPIDKEPVASPPAAQADEAPSVEPEPAPAPKKRPGRPKKVS